MQVWPTEIRSVSMTFYILMISILVYQLEMIQDKTKSHHFCMDGF